MFKLFAGIAAFSVFLSTAIAQNGSIVVDHVTGLSQTGKIIPGKPITFYLRVTNDIGVGVSQISTTFKVTSPDGATWDTTHFTSVWNAQNLFDGSYGALCIGCDGVSPDTARSFAHRLFSSGIPTGFSDIAWTITLGPCSSSDAGKSVCLDTVSSSPFYNWLWAIPPNPTTVVPNWSGQVCYTIDSSCCQGSAGNADGDPNDIADISDLAFLVDYLFITFTYPDCPDEANVDQQGITDISDLFFLIDHLFISFQPLPDCP